jgi:hypothetical protein
MLGDAADRDKIIVPVGDGAASVDTRFMERLRRGIIASHCWKVGKQWIDRDLLFAILLVPLTHNSRHQFSISSLCSCGIYDGFPG